MPEASPTALAKWRKRTQQKGYLYVWKPEVVWKARVNMQTIEYPIIQINYDSVTTGTYTDVRSGMTVLFGSSDGADDLGRHRVRRINDAVLSIGWSSRGTNDGEVNLADNAYITVIDDYRVWNKTPRILDDGTIYKDTMVVVGDYNVYPPPVANAGLPVATMLNEDDTEYIAALDGSDSIAIADFATIDSYLWDIGDGTLETGYALSDDIIQVSFPPGRRWCHLTVTDSNGKTHTAHVPVVVCHPTSFPAITKFEVTRNLTLQGQTAEFTVYQDLDEDDYPDGTLVVYWQEEKFGGEEDTLAGTGRNVKFMGWHATDNNISAVASTYIDTSVTLSCVDVLGRLNQLAGFPQVIERKISPTTWAEMANPNINKYIHYLLQWHSTALDLADFDLSYSDGDSYPFTALESEGATIYEQANYRAEAIAHRLTIDSGGRLYVVPDPQWLDTSDRTNTVILTLEASDWENLTLTNARYPTTHWLDGAAIQTSVAEVGAIDPVPLFSVAPGKAPGQGGTKATKNYQLVIDQNELNTRTGHQYAQYNKALKDIKVTLTRSGDIGIDPAFMQWVKITVPEGAKSPRKLSFNNVRFLPTTVAINFDANTGTSTIVLTLEREVIGTPAETYIPPGADYPPYTPPPTIYPVIRRPTIVDVDDLPPSPSQAGWAWLLTSNNRVVRTKFIFNQAVGWEDITNNLPSGWTWTDLAIRFDDSSSPDIVKVRVVGHNSSGAIRVYTTSAGIAESDASVIWSLYHTTSVQTTTHGYTPPRIVTTKNDETEAWWVVWADCYRTQYVKNTGSPVTVGDDVEIYNPLDTDNDIADYFLGATVEGQKLITTGRKTGSYVVSYSLYVETSAGSNAFSQVGTDEWDTPICDIDAVTGVLYYSVWDEGYFTVSKNAVFSITLNGEHPASGTQVGSATVKQELSTQPSNIRTDLQLGSYYDFTATIDTEGEVPISINVTTQMYYLYHGTSINPAPQAFQPSGYLSSLGYYQADITVIGELSFYTTDQTATQSEVLVFNQFTAPGSPFNIVSYEGQEIIYFDASSFVTNSHVPSEVSLSALVSNVYYNPSGGSSLAFPYPPATGDWYDFELTTTLYVPYVKVNPSANYLIKVTDYSGSPTVTDVTPPSGHTPRYPYGISINATDPNGDAVTIAGQREESSGITNRTWGTLDGADEWTVRNTLDYTIICSYDSLFLCGGSNLLRLYSGEVIGLGRDRLGNLAEVAGNFGRILALKMLAFNVEGT